MLKSPLNFSIFLENIVKRQFSGQKMTKSALVLLAPGAEEMEFVIAADVLRRCGVSSRDFLIKSRNFLTLTKLLLGSSNSRRLKWT